MKKTSLLISVFFCFLQFVIFRSEAQILYGTTFNEGRDGGGTIIKFAPSANDLTVAKSFGDLARYPRYTHFIQAKNGKLYGMTSAGGSRGNGVIFSYDPSSATYTSVKDFDSNRGGVNPFGSLVEAKDGKLYGMTASGGGSTGFYGVIFSLDPSSNIYTVVKTFEEEDGGNPYGSLVEANDGKLYGMTSNAGGSIFSFDPSTSIYTKLLDFDNTNGTTPIGSLIQASDGKLYGMTSEGGSNSLGVIFSYDPASASYTKLKDFGGGSGESPNGDLVEAPDGKLYGMTTGGGDDGYGFIFSFDPSSATYADLKGFDNVNGRNPYGNLTVGSNGILYGMTAFGGSSNSGVIFSFDPSSSNYTKLKDFDASSGSSPNGSLMQANDGKLYAMTLGGGNNSVGVIFSFDPSSSTYTKLRDFDRTQGAYPHGALLQASNGNLYGLTFTGSGEGGSIFSFDPSSSTYTTVKSFDNLDSGIHPYGSLVQLSDGKLFGMTIEGGNIDYGVIFSFDPSSSTYKKLKDFDYTNGGYPTGSLVQASDGKLYGLASQGGSNLSGVIFSFDPSSSAYTNVKDFDDEGGNYPYGSLIQANDGKLYGMTQRGGSNGIGVVFSFDPSSSTYTKLLDFDKTNGASPFNSFIKASDGKLYAMTIGGGSMGSGVIFSYDPASASFTTLHNFNNAEGASPYGNLMEASDGKLYGMTSSGGSANSGVIFSFDPSSSTYTKLKDLDRSSGAHPSFGSAFIELRENQNKPPTVGITAPTNNATYLAPAAHIKLSAAASDSDGTISKVEFYSGNTLLHTETVTPYGFVWKNVPLGNYTLTAKAYDNSGNVTTSDAVHISVVPNKPPTVSIIAPENNEHYAAPAYIHLEAAASDIDGRITRVEFYNGSTLLRTEYKYPYTFVWKNVPVGTYIITAVATDNWGAQTISEPIIVKVKPETEAIVSSKSLVNNKNNLSNVESLKLYPNPANQTLNIYTTGLKQNKQTTLSIISASGIVWKKMQINTLSQSIQLNVSALAKGVYTIKLLSGEKVIYKQFVKL